jgi:hypothetical protein
MGLIIYDKTNTGSLGARSVSINKRTSFLIFSMRAAEDFGWKEGDLLVFAQDEDHPKQWFIASLKGDVRDAFALKKRKEKGLIIQSRGLSQAIVDSIDTSLESIKFLIGVKTILGADGTEFYPLIVTSKKESYDTPKKRL